MKHYSDKSCEEIAKASLHLDKVCMALDEIPEGGLEKIISDISMIVASLEAILSDEKY